MEMKKLTLALCASLVMLTTACSTTQGPLVKASESNRVQDTVYARIVSVRQVSVQGEGSLVGQGTGAILGGMLGNKVGGGRGKIAGAILGAVGGAMAGNAVEKQVKTKQGVEIAVKLNDGREIAIVQDDQGEGFRQGETVRVVVSGSVARVMR